MEKIVAAFTVSALAIGGVFVFVIIATLIGGIAGWCVGLVFGDTILGIASQLGIHGISMFDFGVFLGFVGCFLKTKTGVDMKKG